MERQLALVWSCFADFNPQRAPPSSGCKSTWYRCQRIPLRKGNCLLPRPGTSPLCSALAADSERIIPENPDDCIHFPALLYWNTKQKLEAVDEMISQSSVHKSEMGLICKTWNQALPRVLGAFGSEANEQEGSSFHWDLIAKQIRSSSIEAMLKLNCNKIRNGLADSKMLGPMLSGPSAGRFSSIYLWFA